MLILAIFAAGILIGFRWFPERWKRFHGAVQLGCTAALVFCMGVMLGSREHFWSELGRLGLDSLLLAVVPMAFSAVLVFFFRRWWEKRRANREDKEGGA